MEAPVRVLYVEDEQPLALAVAKVLKKNNYAVDLAHDGPAGLDMAGSGVYDLILLDVMLPGMNGVDVLARLREDGVDTPVILLTARDAVKDKVKGLDAGADDYLAKPYLTDELLARMRALGRRKDRLVMDSTLTVGDIVFNFNTLNLAGDGESFRLTLKEGQLLELLMQNVGQTVTTTSIIEKLWGWDSYADNSHVQVQISFLRKKLRLLSPTVTIETIYGVGYRLNEGTTEAEEGTPDVP